ncbi:glycosyltransferase [Streptomyces sp. SCSIO ZS0520]|uniref:glycosyltransferase n=1 Tax=Streptomyces sp. SCSIO ZS0520 TaxID=2892996 RepID=UPI0021D8B0FF|nr:glycosyltransferase [Streptomyces sp. SCSIO ZS0520]
MKSSMPEGISFVIPCFNSGGYLLEAVESLIQQPRLVDLIRMAEFDLEQALTVACQRQFSLSSPFEGLGIP